ncbi:MAG TPA: hypothetical protein VG410_01990 [Solirubrobacteraceae bacterium]|nr:hypothetical protein [Solirubrobacteraceae bacterium]
MRALGLVALALALSACGFDVRSGDDFLLTRVGGGHRLTLLVNDGGTIRCDGGAAKPISNSLLIDARDLVVNLDGDATRGLSLRSPADSVYRYTVRLQDGTISFPDTAAGTHHELTGVEEFVLRAVAGPCRGSG